MSLRKVIGEVPEWTIGAASVVLMLVKAVKGKPDLSGCDNWKQAPGDH